MAILQLFIDICLFRKGPQDVPASTLLFTLAVVTYLTVGTFLMAPESGWLLALFQAVLQGLLLSGFVAAALALARKQGRFLQSATALYACDALVSGLAIPLLNWVRETPEIQPVSLLLLGLMIWNLAVIGHILRHALTKPFAFGLGLAFLYLFAGYTVMITLFGP